MNGVSICQSILLELQNLLKSDAFREKYRIGNCFSRNRKIGFSSLIYFLLQLSHKSLPSRIADFLEDFPQLGITDITKQAVSKARKGIQFQTFEEFVRLSVSHYYNLTQSRKRWHDYYILAVDGTSLQLPQTRQNIEEFGISTNQSGAEFPMAAASILFDVLNDIIIDAQINICNYSERKFALQHLVALEQLKPDEKKILIFDRGYASYDFCKYLSEKNLYFVMRLKKSCRAMRNVETDDAIIDYGPQYPKGQTTKLRALRIHLPDEDEILLTNLFSSQLTVSMFRELYFLRWGVEAKYQELKNRFQVENFSGTSPHAIRQDFYIAIFYSNLVSILKKDVDSSIQKTIDCTSKEFSYQGNRGFLISRIQKHWVKILAGFEEALAVLQQIVLAATKVRSQVRANRKYERKIRHSKRKYHHNRKPCL